MIEDLNMIMSLFCLAIVPMALLFYGFFRLFSRKKENVLTTSEKYYREW